VSWSIVCVIVTGDAHLEQRLDQVGALLGHAVGEFLHRDRLRHHDVADLLGLRLARAAHAAMFLLARTLQRGERTGARAVIVAKRTVDRELARLAAIVALAIALLRTRGLRRRRGARPGPKARGGRQHAAVAAVPARLRARRRRRGRLGLRRGISGRCTGVKRRGAGRLGSSWISTGCGAGCRSGRRRGAGAGAAGSGAGAGAGAGRRGFLHRLGRLRCAGGFSLGAGAFPRRGGFGLDRFGALALLAAARFLERVHALLVGFAQQLGLALLRDRLSSRRGGAGGGGGGGACGRGRGNGLGRRRGSSATPPCGPRTRRRLTSTTTVFERPWLKLCFTLPVSTVRLSPSG
jgi:hypothetical protein